MITFNLPEATARTSGRYAIRTATAASRVGTVAAALFLLALASAPYWLGRAEMRLVVEVCYYLALAQMWNLLAGYTGLVSVGQQAYVGLGGYALFLLVFYLGLSPLLAVPLAGVVAAAFAAPTAFVVFRLRGAYFAIGTWVVAEVYMLAFAQVSALGGGSGMSLPAGIVRGIAASAQQRESLIYWTALAIAIGAIAAVYALLRSRYGLALTAIRDSEEASESLGVNNRGLRFVVYVLAGFATGAVGALIFLQKLRISPEAAFSVLDWTAYVIFIVVIGGIGTIEGPIVGVIVFFLLREFLADLGTWYLILLGGLAVVVMLFAPKGLWGLVADRFDLHVFPIRRRVIGIKEGDGHAQSV